MKKTLDENKMLQAAKVFIFNTFINNYAVERVAFGFEKPGDRAPIELYLKHLPIEVDDETVMRNNIPGVYIDKQERISTEQDYSEYVHDLFVTQMERIFWDAPKDIALEHASEEIPLVSHYRERLFGFLPLFAEILNVEVEYGVFDVIPTDKAERATEYHKWKKFVTAVLFIPLKPGSRINRYVEEFTNAPYYIRRLIEQDGENFYLKPTDIQSYEYAFALFSLMQFLNDENVKILELKMFEWERRHNTTAV